MESSVPSMEDECPLPHLTNSYQLQLDYEESLRQAGHVIQEETTRRLQLRILLLEDDSDDLNSQLVVEDEHTFALEDERDRLQRSLEEATQEAQRYEGDLKARARELGNLKIELASMYGVSVDSAKLLTEKLSLTRELATLRPELEHLRLQSTSQSILIAEKLSLRRQVKTLEVELETEKRATRKPSNKKQGTDKEEELQALVEELQKDIAKERREHEKQQRSIQKDAADWEAREGQLKGKLDDFRTKLRVTKAQLKEAQEDLNRFQSVLASSTGTVPNPRKRNAVKISSDATIGTPDGVAIRGKRIGVKRGKPDSTILGEKSAFSITPFLNRTINVASGTPQSNLETRVVGKSDDIERECSPVPAPRGTKTSSAEEAVQTVAELTRDLYPSKRDTDAVALQEVKTGAVNAKVAPRKQRVVEMLNKVTEGDENAESPGGKVTRAPITEKVKSMLKTSSILEENIEPKKKRRKLLGGGMTLFDDDDGDAPRRPAKLGSGAPRNLIRTGAKGSLLSAPTTVRFGAFSPLKKDKRGVNASFHG